MNAIRRTKSNKCNHARVASGDLHNHTTGHTVHIRSCTKEFEKSIFLNLCANHGPLHFVTDPTRHATKKIFLQDIGLCNDDSVPDTQVFPNPIGSGRCSLKF